MEKSLTISNWLRSGEYHTLIDSVYTKIIRNCESSRNESQTASVFETEISFLVRNQLGIELYFSKEENVDGIVHKFAGLTSRQSGHGRLDAVVNDIVIEYKHMTNYLFFDTETTGVPRNYKAPSSDTRNWPRLVQLAWILTDENGNRIHTGNQIVKPDGFVIPADAAKVHGISTQRAMAEGIPLNEVINQFKAVSAGKPKTAG